MSTQYRRAAQELGHDTDKHLIGKQAAAGRKSKHVALPLQKFVLRWMSELHRVNSSDGLPPNRSLVILFRNTAIESEAKYQRLRLAHEIRVRINGVNRVRFGVTRYPPIVNRALNGAAGR